MNSFPFHSSWLLRFWEAYLLTISSFGRLKSWRSSTIDDPALWHASPSSLPSHLHSSLSQYNALGAIPFIIVPQLDSASSAPHTMVNSRYLFHQSNKFYLKQSQQLPCVSWSGEYWRLARQWIYVKNYFYILQLRKSTHNSIGKMEVRRLVSLLHWRTQTGYGLVTPNTCVLLLSCNKQDMRSPPRLLLL